MSQTKSIAWKEAAKKGKGATGSRCNLLQRWGLSLSSILKKWAFCDFHQCEYQGVWNSCPSRHPYMLEQRRRNIVIASSVTGDIVADAGETAYDKSSTRWLNKMLGRGIRKNRHYPRELFTTWICAYTNDRKRWPSIRPRCRKCHLRASQ